MQRTIQPINLKRRARVENKRRKLVALDMISRMNIDDQWKAILNNNNAEEVPPPPKRIKLDKAENNVNDQKQETLNKNLGINNVNVCNGVKGQPELVKQNLTEDEVKELRLLIRKRFAAKKNIPKLYMKEVGLQASVDNAKNKKTPLFLSDVQHFILYSLHGHMSTGNIPRWATIEKFANIKNILFLVVEGMSCNDYTNYEHLCPKLKEFPHKLEVITPLAYGGCLTRELATLPLTESQRHRLEKKFGSMGEARASNKVYKLLRTMFPMSLCKSKNNNNDNDKKINNDCSKEDAFPRTELLLTPLQMLEENYPLAMEGELKSLYGHFVYTKDKYEEVTPNSPMWALDCEMCLTKQGNELTRVSVINEKCESIYESFVKPYNPIINYLTRFSGITPRHLRDVTVRLEDVQKHLREIMPPDLILVGQSLGSDLKALQMLHPYCIDTAVIFNLSGERIRKTKLKVLSAEFLGEQIQVGSSGHDSIEDSAASMKLVKEKLKHSLEWGNAVIAGPDAVQRLLAERKLLFPKLERPVYNVTAKPPEKRKEDSIPEPSPQIIKKPVQTVTRAAIIKEPQSLPKFVAGEDVLQVQMFTTSLFSHLVTYDKKSLLVGKSMVINDFIKYMPEDLKLFQPESRIQVSEQPTNKAIIKFGRNNAPDSGVTMMYTTVERNPENTAVKVNALVKKLTKNISGHVLIAVLLAGRNTEFDELDTSNQGLLLLDLHQEPVPPIRLPREINAS